MMNIVQILAVIIAVGAILYIRNAVSSGAVDQSRSVGYVTAAAWTFMALGVAEFFMPWAAGALEKEPWVASGQFGILMSGNYVIGFLTVVAGIALARTAGQRSRSEQQRDS
jgi:hypothetical protein